MVGRLAKVSQEDGLAIIAPLVSALKEIDEIERIILFGSLATNRMTEASDIDLAILVNSSCNIREVRKKVREIKRSIVSWPMDLVILAVDWFESRKDFGGVCFEISADGKELFNRESERKSA